jgi:hypothetical protein
MGEKSHLISHQIAAMCIFIRSEIHATMIDTHEILTFLFLFPMHHQQESKQPGKDFVLLCIFKNHPHVSNKRLTNNINPVWKVGDECKCRDLKLNHNDDHHMQQQHIIHSHTHTHMFIELQIDYRMWWVMDETRAHMVHSALP